MKKNVLVVFIIVVAALSVPLFIQRSLHDWGVFLPPPNSLPVRQIVQAPHVSDVSVFLAAGGSTFEIRVPEGASAYDVMRLARDTMGFRFEGREFKDLGFFVESVNGEKQDTLKGLYWIYKINGQKAKVGISGYKVKQNDVIEWTYEHEE